MVDRALVFDIKRDATEDGPGIRTTIFFKGCPLSCSWCQNPEGMGGKPELSFASGACDPARCGTPCIEACPEGCLRLASHSPGVGKLDAGPGELEARVGKLEVRRSDCTRCDACIQVCPFGALEAVGEWFTIDQLLYRVSVDIPFYRATGGGVTLSGGEPTAQMDFLHRLLSALEELGIHTAIETCGLFEYKRFAQLVLPHVRLIYFDLKIFDEEACRRHTGCSNRPVLENFTRLVRQARVPVVPRIALVPGVTATRRNLNDLARFLRSLGVGSCCLLPYNPLWAGKLDRLGMKALFDNRTFMTPGEIDDCVDWLLEAAGSDLPGARIAAGG